MKTTNRRSLTLPTLIAASLISMTAVAAGPQLFDIDGNGLISAEEITQIRDEYKAMELASYDTDGDGQLSREEHDVIRSDLRAICLSSRPMKSRDCLTFKFLITRSWQAAISSV